MKIENRRRYLSGWSIGQLVFEVVKCSRDTRDAFRDKYEGSKSDIAYLDGKRAELQRELDKRNPRRVKKAEKRIVVKIRN